MQYLWKKTGFQQEEIIVWFFRELFPLRSHLVLYVYNTPPLLRWQGVAISTAGLVFYIISPWGIKTGGNVQFVTSQFIAVIWKGKFLIMQQLTEISLKLAVPCNHPNGRKRGQQMSLQIYKVKKKPAVK